MKHNQSKKVGDLRLEWSGKEGINTAGNEVQGFIVEWPANGGYCGF